MTSLPSSGAAWKALESHVQTVCCKLQLRQLLADPSHCAASVVEFDGIVLDFARQKVTKETLSLLLQLYEENGVREKIRSMAAGQHINTTEDRAVGHIALRAAPTDVYDIDGINMVPEVLSVRQKIQQFSQQVRNGLHKGHTGKLIRNIIAVGIGGSYLGANFVAEALAVEPLAAKASQGRQLRFLANVDPVAVNRATLGLNPEESLVVVISKTFTTRETMLNARTLKRWLIESMKDESCISRHMVAVSTNLQVVAEFGINPQNAFGFWDWVGGRYSVTSAVGLLPLALHYGWEQVEMFLKGCRSIDQHFLNTAPEKNIPVLLGLLGVFNSSFLKLPARALICYSEAMHTLASHIQQVDMESNGKSVTLDGSWVDYPTGEIDFGEPGTNAQHSFFQLIHQGQVVPVDFIGFCQSQTEIDYTASGEEVSNHTELMCNFFAQPDALAQGKTTQELQAEGVASHLCAHRTFPGNRPSNILLLQKLTAYEIGQILAIYEHRTAVQGFVWNINSFDQWGVELGKKLADQVRNELKKCRLQQQNVQVNKFNPSTNALLSRFTQFSQSKL